jgi:hypothetical protein
MRYDRPDISKCKTMFRSVLLQFVQQLVGYTPLHTEVAGGKALEAPTFAPFEVCDRHFQPQSAINPN